MSLNKNLVLISGKSTTGKSFSLKNINNHEGVMYLNTESGKELPFKHDFKTGIVIDPLQVPAAFDKAESMDDIHTIVVDSLTFMMDAYESMYVLNSPNSMKMWGEFAQFFKKLMQVQVARSTKNVLFLAHTLDTLNESTMSIETSVPVKGSLKNNGIESYFNTVISTKKVSLKDLAKYQSPFLNITEDDEELEYKHVFQTRLTKATIGERIRHSDALFNKNETYIDNNIQFVLDRLKDYYS